MVLLKDMIPINQVTKDLKFCGSECINGEIIEYYLDDRGIKYFYEVGNNGK